MCFSAQKEASVESLVSATATTNSYSTLEWNSKRYTCLKIRDSHLPKNVHNIYRNLSWLPEAWFSLRSDALVLSTTCTAIHGGPCRLPANHGLHETGVSWIRGPQLRPDLRRLQQAHETLSHSLNTMSYLYLRWATCPSFPRIVPVLKQKSYIPGAPWIQDKPKWMLPGAPSFGLVTIN